MSGSNSPIICIVGPTGAGKSALALFLARHLNGAIINADSRQMYRDFPVITAQPTPEDWRTAPHCLYGFLDTKEKISAGRFADMAQKIIAYVSDKGKLPIVVGGTGLYIRSLLQGMANIPAVPKHIHEGLISICRRCGSVALHERLAQIDPICAARIHPHDKQRILRGLEVFEATGKPLSWWQKNHHKPGFAGPVLSLAVGADISSLLPILERRIENMLISGAVEEAKRARKRCDDPDAPGWSGIGCAEIYAHLSGLIDEDTMRLSWLYNTRAYAKRQLTWFRADKSLIWFKPADKKTPLKLACDWLKGLAFSDKNKEQLCPSLFI